MDEVLADHPDVLKVIAEMTANALYADSVKWRRLYCLTPHIGSTLMWSHYAENPQPGIAEYAARNPEPRSHARIERILAAEKAV